MGGQASMLHGVPDLTFDTDLAVLVDDPNIAALRRALAELKATRIAVPPFESHYLERGLAVHFRCYHPDAYKQRVDIMSRMRGVAQFEELWARRAILADEDESEFGALSLADLVRSKKTQRDKDWPTIRRLLEADYRRRRQNPSELDVQFWFLELRTPELLIELARDFKTVKDSLGEERPLLKDVRAGNELVLERLLMEEELEIRRIDREYWLPLRAELEQLRRLERRQTSD